jgi:enoyl-CoA hydratase
MRQPPIFLFAPGFPLCKPISPASTCLSHLLLSPLMSFKFLRVEKRAPLATVFFNRPETLHALSCAMLAEVDSLFTALRNDPEVRVVLLTGSGDRAFASGADVAELAGFTPRDGAIFATRAHESFRRIEMFGKPSIACIRGYALSGGLELAVACTMRLAADDAQLGHPDVKFGITPTYGGTQRLPRLIGRSAALRLLLTGEIIGAEEALRIGLVDQVVPAAALMQHAEELAAKIAANAPLAVQAVVQAVDELLDWRADQALLRESERFARLCGTEDKNEGMRAFLEKRKPTWKSR